MNEQPRGCTGETCKADGTYACERGVKQYYGVGEPFGPCPVSGKETKWEKTT